MNPLTPTEDIRAARHKLAAKFDNNLDEIVADLQHQQAASDAEFITLPSRLPKHTTNQSMHGSGGGSVVVSGESTPAAP
jgi:hypothetical protein